MWQGDAAAARAYQEENLALCRTLDDPLGIASALANLCEAVDLRAGERVLDVAAGNGNATLAAARRFARVTSTDYVAALLERGQRRAEAEGLDVTFQAADATTPAAPHKRRATVPGTFKVLVYGP